jgi:hypothetical protein
MPIWWSWDGTAWGICGFVLGEAVAGPSPQRRLFSRGALTAHECQAEIRSQKRGGLTSRRRGGLVHE